MENNAANVNQRVGQRVAQLRTAAGLSQRELAAQISLRLGREFGTVTATRLEGGKRPITVDELAAAAQALGSRPATCSVTTTWPPTPWRCSTRPAT